jgi:hypothetical protein
MLRLLCKVYAFVAVAINHRKAVNVGKCRKTKVTSQTKFSTGWVLVGLPLKPAPIILLRVGVVLPIAHHTGPVLCLHNTALSGWEIDMRTKPDVLLTHTQHLK